MIGRLQDGGRAAREAGAVAARRLQIAAVTTAAESFVPPLMRAFSDRHPDIRLTLDVGNRQYVFERVLAVRPMSRFPERPLSIVGSLPSR